MIRPERRMILACCTVFLMMSSDGAPPDLFDYLHTALCLLLGAVALYWGVTGKDIYSSGIVRTNIPLPRPLGRLLCFAIAGTAFYFLVSGLR